MLVWWLWRQEVKIGGAERMIGIITENQLAFGIGLNIGVCLGVCVMGICILIYLKRKQRGGE